ncbi:MAG: SH3 domain-containing protein [Pseudonocardiaceae bacterium]
MANKKRWIIGAGVAVGIFLLFAAQNSQTPLGSSGTVASTSRPCTVRVTVDSLNVRSSPDSFASVVQTYSKGEVMTADRTIRNGFRQLGSDHWAKQEFLDPTPGSDCG